MQLPCTSELRWGERVNIWQSLTCGKCWSQSSPWDVQGREAVAGLGAQRCSHKKPVEGRKLCIPLWVVRRKEDRAWDVADSVEARGSQFRYLLEMALVTITVCTWWKSGWVVLGWGHMVLPWSAITPCHSSRPSLFTEYFFLRQMKWCLLSHGLLGVTFPSSTLVFQLGVGFWADSTSVSPYFPRFLISFRFQVIVFHSASGPSLIFDLVWDSCMLCASPGPSCDGIFSGLSHKPLQTSLLSLLSFSFYSQRL